ncbi:MAG: molybdenum cofactor biosynthesis protein MoaE [Alphaproteobacteria bacterium]|nr:molybdenum cofactor biosynthesis protein MoaE [Alphaproteobacteria bacterium]
MIKVQKEDFDVGVDLKALMSRAKGVGGIVTFTGIVREWSGEQQLAAMTLEHYPGMTERLLEEIEAEALERWPIEACLIIHRYGRLEPGANIVLCITASAHRKAAFEANEFLVDWLKTKAPFWKLEAGPGGDSWVAAKASDDAAAEKWALKPAAKRRA